MRFGISTHLFHDLGSTGRTWRRLRRPGSTSIELFATRSHFDYHDAARDRGARRVAGRHGADPQQRARADHRDDRRRAPATSSRMRVRRHARAGARCAKRKRRSRSPARSRSTSLVVHLGTPAGRSGAGDNTARGAAQRRRDLPRGRAARGERRVRSDPERDLDAGRSGRPARTGPRRAATSASASTSATRT